MSPGLQMIRLCYEAGVTRTSLVVWMGRMHDAVMTAITCGLTFEKEDFQTIMRWGNSAWVGQNYFEKFYGRASGVLHRDHVKNPSALRALEFYMGRKPFVYQGNRLVIGREIEIPGEMYPWRVSSIHDREEPYVNLVGACVGNQSKRKRLTLAEVRAMEKARKGGKTEEREEG